MKPLTYIKEIIRQIIVQTVTVPAVIFVAIIAFVVGFEDCEN